MAKCQNVGDYISYIPWKKVVLNNEAEFTIGKLNWGSGFLIHYKNDTIACTAREFTGTIRSPGKMLYIKDFPKEMKYWKMFVSDDPIQYVELDTIFNKEKIEKKFSIVMLSDSYLTFSLKKKNKNLIPLTPDVRKIPNKDTLYIIGFDNDHNIRIIPGVVEMALNEKYAELEIRMKTDVYLYHPGFVGAPIVDKYGKVVGLVNRAYSLYKTKKGRIINDAKKVDGAYYEYFINGTTMRSILGKNYQNEITVN
ncbi:MAG: hypothetical protein ACM3O8_03740 [Methylococcaceae bacterium]